MLARLSVRRAPVVALGRPDAVTLRVVKKKKSHRALRQLDPHILKLGHLISKYAEAEELFSGKATARHALVVSTICALEYIACLNT